MTEDSVMEFEVGMRLVMLVYPEILQEGTIVADGGEKKKSIGALEG